MLDSDSESSIPTSHLIKLFDYTGNANGSNKGFLLFYVNENGDPSCCARFSDSTTEMALMKAVEVMLENAEAEE